MNGAARFAVTATKSIKTQLPQKFIYNQQSLGAVRYFSVTQGRNMRLLQFAYPDRPCELKVGYLEGDTIVDLNKADPELPQTLLEILRNGDLEKVKMLKAKGFPSSLNIHSAILRAPIHGMDKILCIGLNYMDHCAEQNLTPPKVPMVFSKFASCVIGQSDPLRLRVNSTEKVDWEAELCLVIGKKASNVKAGDAMDYILGATIAQDISARDWQKERNGGQFLLGKAMDDFCPIGPWIVTSDELGDLEKLNIRCCVNGVEKQKSNTDQLVHKIRSIIERITSVMTLLPGDLILTGTPGGVGMYRKPPEYLKPGDVITTEIDKIGRLTIECTTFCQ